jgi:dipeptide/tripeptide permease
VRTGHTTYTGHNQNVGLINVIILYLAAMMGLDNIGFVANMASLVLYFMLIMNFDISGSANTTTNYLGTCHLLTLVGGFISDSYMTRLNTCVLFGGIQQLLKFTFLSTNNYIYIYIYVLIPS